MYVPLSPGKMCEHFSYFPPNLSESPKKRLHAKKKQKKKQFPHQYDKN